MEKSEVRRPELAGRVNQPASAWGSLTGLAKHSTYPGMQVGAGAAVSLCACRMQAKKTYWNTEHAKHRSASPCSGINWQMATYLESHRSGILFTLYVPVYIYIHFDMYTCIQ